MDGGWQSRSGDAQADVHPPGQSGDWRAVDAESRLVPQAQVDQQHFRQARLRKWHDFIHRPSLSDGAGSFYVYLQGGFYCCFGVYFFFSCRVSKCRVRHLRSLLLRSLRVLSPGFAGRNFDRHFRAVGDAHWPAPSVVLSVAFRFVGSLLLSQGEMPFGTHRFSAVCFTTSAFSFLLRCCFFSLRSVRLFFLGHTH